MKLPHGFAFIPRAMSLEAAAHYLGVSKRQIEEYVEQGKLKTRRLPAAQGDGYLRRTLIEREELDRLFEQGISL